MKNYEPHEIRLANELAETLRDRDAYQYYLTLTRKYNEDYLRRVLAKVMSIDEKQIRKTRGALFTFLVNQREKAKEPYKDDYEDDNDPRY